MSTHVDRVFQNPLGGEPRLLGRFLSADDPAIGAQERDGWATYVHISEPHTMEECPFVRREWQRCPVCEGCGSVPTDFYLRLGSATNTAREQCRTCGGRGVIEPPSRGQPPSTKNADRARGENDGRE